MIALLVSLAIAWLCALALGIALRRARAELARERDRTAGYIAIARKDADSSRAFDAERKDALRAERDAALAERDLLRAALPRIGRVLQAAHYMREMAPCDSADDAVEGHCNHCNTAVDYDTAIAELLPGDVPTDDIAHRCVDCGGREGVRPTPTGLRCWSHRSDGGGV